MQVKSPKVERACHYIEAGVCYSLSFVLFLYFLMLILLWATTERDLSALQTTGVFGFVLLLPPMAKILKAQGGRARLAVRQKQRDV